jgi:3-deoxy-D-manno-octulosonic-acid transferase
MRRVYNLLFEFFLLLLAPYYLVKLWRRGNWRNGFGQRFGKFSSKTKQALTNRQMLWLHAASVGEVGLLTQLLAILEPRVELLKLVVSTNTTTGMAELRRRLPSHIEKIYYPLDLRRWVARSVNVVHPEAVVLVEAEIWPNFLWRLHDRGIPVFLVNARFSERSHRGYRRLGFLFRPLFATFAGVGAQSEEDVRRLVDLGFRREAIRVVGSLKFDAAELGERRSLDVPSLLRQLGVSADARIVVAGSTHAGEEAALAGICRRLRSRFPDLLLVLVPRHFERGKEVGRELKTLGVRYAYRTAVTSATRYAPGALDCLIVNTTGELRLFYEHASVVFVGKSLSAHGGQNPVEPGAAGRAILFGPHMENFAAIADALVAGGGAIRVRDGVELERALSSLLEDAARRAELGVKALAVVQASRGALARTAEIILEELTRRGVLAAPGSGAGSA